MLYETYSQKQARQAKAGQPDVYTYDKIPVNLRHQIIHIWKRAFGEYGYHRHNVSGNTTPNLANDRWKSLKSIMVEAFSLRSLESNGYSGNAQEQFEEVFVRVNDTLALDLIVLTLDYMADTSKYGSGGRPTQQFVNAIDEINTRLKQHSIGFEYTNQQLIRKDSEYLHAEAVLPVLALLNSPGFAGPQSEFLEAHKHLRAGEYQDAIVDAAKAFESTMKAICTLRGWTYDPNRATASVLVNLVINAGLIDPSMTQQMTSFRTLMESGVPTLRNRNGGHGSGGAPAEVAEYVASYALHLAASNIVFLVEAHKAKP